MSPQQLLASEKRHQWHPFTPMDGWNDASHTPIIIDRGEGPYLFDSEGNRYLDGNSSIWTNVHGHNHPTINQAIRDQLEQVAHSSFLGLTHRPAIELAKKLAAQIEGSPLPRVFFSDDGSTAIECALKMALQFWQLQGLPERSELVAFDHAYHGDTLGANSVGGLDSFHGRFSKMGLKTHHVADIATLRDLPRSTCKKLAAIVIEPLIQGAAGMRLWPKGMLAQICDWCDANSVLLILDEVMTGFGRTGKMFAFQHEGIVPDILCLAKGITGGYLPLAATLTNETVFKAFLGAPENAFYHGHSYTANPLGCAAALASLQVFEEEKTLENLAPKIEYLSYGLAALESACPQIAATRQCGFIAGIDLAKADGSSLDPPDLTGAHVCEAARAHGLLTRPVRDTIVLMPPLCISLDQLDEALLALTKAIVETIR